MIKGIIFDLDGVYFKNGTKNFLDNISSKYDVDRDKVAQAYLKSEQMQKYKRGELSGEEYWQWFVSELGIDIGSDELLNLLLDGYEVNAKAIKIIEEVREKGIKAIICSNNFKERIEILDKKFDFQKDFDYVVLSYKYGILKPDLLGKVNEESGFGNSEILVIDDGEKIIAEANRRGYQTILCEDPDMLEKYLEGRGI